MIRHFCSPKTTFTADHDVSLGVSNVTKRTNEPSSVGENKHRHHYHSTMVAQCVDRFSLYYNFQPSAEGGEGTRMIEQEKLTSHTLFGLILLSSANEIELTHSHWIYCYLLCVLQRAEYVA